MEPSHEVSAQRQSRVMTLHRHAIALLGIAILACIPGIFLAERYDWPEWPWHLSQMLLSLICVVTSALSLWKFVRITNWWHHLIPLIAGIGSGGWLMVVATVVSLLNFNGLDAP
jgi:hypothetical protein